MTALVSRPCFHHWQFFLGVSRHGCFFCCCLCFFLLYMSSSGTIQLAGTLDQCTRGIPAKQTNMAARTLHMQMCPVSFTDGSVLSSSHSLRQWTSECMSPSYTQSHMRKQHIHKHWLSKPKDTTETNMSVPRAWAAIIPIEKAVVVWGEKNNNVCLLILTVCADTHRLCVCIITLMLWNLWKRMIHDYDVGQ